ncbi:MAG: PP2C family protein-serine/threonine phosphatase [Phycisphaerae bacterium]
MPSKRKLLWISDASVPPNLRKALGDEWELAPCAFGQTLEAQLAEAGLAVIYPNGRRDDPLHLGMILGALERTPAVALLMLDGPRRTRGSGASHGARPAVAGRSGQFLCAAADSTPRELAAKLTAAAALQPAIRELHAELASARKLAATAGAMEELDEELRLAARLQRDFLPRRMPEVGPVRFGVLYRPASWLSGDIYDVTRLDERHVGFYVADAVGHGMPAALLTMFIKHALQTKRIVGSTYQIVPPEVSLAELNADICRQNLTSCQFCTAVYAVLDTETLTLTYCRAGHPPPIIFRNPNSTIGNLQSTILDAPGSLLGVFPEETYQSRTAVLAPGDRLVLYTDGAEEALRRADGKGGLEKLLAPLAAAPRDEMLLRLAAMLDDAAGNPNSRDDITVMVVDVQRES